MGLSDLEWLYIIGIWLMAALCGLIAMSHTPGKEDE